MITLQHRNQLQAFVQQGDAASIHQMLSLFSVADQKQAKLVLARYLSEGKDCSLPDSLHIYVQLMQLNLNLYFKMFALVCEKFRTQPEFWDLLDELLPLGQLLKENKAYYRQTILRVLMHQLTPDIPVVRLFQIFKVQEVKAQLIYLLEADSLFACYQLIILAAQNDVDPIVLTKCAKQLLTNDKSTIPFYIREDVVSFMVHYFNGFAIRYPFKRTFDSSLLSYAEQSFDTFSKVIVPAKRFDL